MLSAIPNQFITFCHLRQLSLMLPMFLGGWLALIFYCNPAQAQIHIGSVMLAQAAVEPLPLPPSTNLQPIPYNQQALPLVEPTQPVPLSQYDQNTQTTYQTTPSYQYDYQNQYQNQYQNNQNFGRYLVVIDNSNRQVLQQVRRVERTAYLRQYQGRSVIQAGAFNKPGNAQQRVRELESYGINGARVVSLSNGPETPYNPDRGYSRNNRSNYYYVVIPGRSQDLPQIEERIRRNIGQSIAILQRNQPRGSHIAVGPFIQRPQAEEWNNYLRNLGFANARVYYGK